ncbi:hypothetical protein BG003_000582 [Podila horticola]|nr:hypothetical protein BG003_000582 [Podila horticola]
MEELTSILMGINEAITARRGSNMVCGSATMFRFHRQRSSPLVITASDTTTSNTTTSNITASDITASDTTASDITAFDAST